MAGSGAHLQRPVGAQLGQRGGQRQPGHGRGALSDDLDPGDAPGGQALADVVGQGVGPEGHGQPAAGVDQLAPQRLAEAVGRLRDLLQQVVGEVAAVDVPGGDLGGAEVVRGDGQRGAVVGEAGDALQRPRPAAVEHDDLAPAGGGVVGVGGRLAVHPQVAVGDLDDAVGLAGHHVGVVGQADVEGLAAAPEGQQHGVGLGAGRGADGDRSLEAGHRVAERGGEVGALGHPPGHQGRDDLGVGGDLGGDPQAVEGLEVGEVVDVAVERGDDVGGVVAAFGQLGAVDRVGVGLADDADRGPAGVAEHDRHGVAGERQPQQVVGPEGGAQRGGVVAQLADLGRRLVDERQAAVDRPDGARPEQRVGGPPVHQLPDGGAVEVEPVVADEDVEAGAVAAPDLEPVDGGQRLLDGHVALGGRPGRLAAGQVGDRPGGADAVLLDRPDGVLEPGDGGVHGLDAGQRGAVAVVARVEPGLDRRDGAAERRGRHPRPRPAAAGRGPGRGRRRRRAAGGRRPRPARPRRCRRRPAGRRRPAW